MANEMTQEQIQKIIAENIELPTPPTIAVQILNTFQKEDSTLQDLARIIAADPALTAKMLRIANSGYYALQSEVTSIERALSVLGTNLIKNIALSFIIAGDYHGKKKQTFDFDYFWRRSVTAAVAAELLSAILKVKNDDIFVAALLHDIGVLVFYLSMGDSYSHLLAERKMCRSIMTELERQAYGFDHTQLSHAVLQSWRIPESICEPIRFHHHPEEAPEEFHQSAQILWFANQLSAVYNENFPAGKVHELQEMMAEAFELDSKTVTQLADEVADQSIEMLKIFEIDPGDIKPYSQMLEEANEELGRINLSYEQLVMELKEAKEEAENLASELREANIRLKELVFRDGLTGVYNHRFFQETLSRELARAQRYEAALSLIMFDIDFFKKVNDQYGHPVGDLVLMNIARVVEASVRPSDVVARYGGEEFAVILPKTNAQGMRVFAERLRSSIEGISTVVEDQQVKVTVSCGCTTFTPQKTHVNKELLIETADRALYLAKKNGRNRVEVLPPAPPTDSR